MGNNVEKLEHCNFNFRTEKIFDKYVILTDHPFPKEEDHFQH